MYTQSFIVSAVAALLAAQATAAPIRARQMPGNILPVGMVTNLPVVAPITAPMTTVTNTNTSGDGGSSGSTGPGGDPDSAAIFRKGSKATKRGNDAGAILESVNGSLEQVNGMVEASLANQGSSMTTPGFATGTGQNHDQVTASGAAEGAEGAGEDDTASEDDFEDIF